MAGMAGVGSTPPRALALARPRRHPCPQPRPLQRCVDDLKRGAAAGCAGVANAEWEEVRRLVEAGKNPHYYRAYARHDESSAVVGDDAFREGFGASLFGRAGHGLLVVGVRLHAASEHAPRSPHRLRVRAGDCTSTSVTHAIEHGSIMDWDAVQLIWCAKRRSAPRVAPPSQRGCLLTPRAGAGSTG